VQEGPTAHGSQNEGSVHGLFIEGFMDQLGGTELPGWSSQWVGEALEANENMEFYGVQDGVMGNDMNAGNFSGMNQTCVSPVRKRRRIRVPR
jgi:hypothetical protein